MGWGWIGWLVSPPSLIVSIGDVSQSTIINQPPTPIIYYNNICYMHVYLYRPFATRSEDHDHHMTVFPSLRPAGRHEVIALKVG